MGVAMFALLTTVLVGASVVWPVSGDCQWCNDDKTICIPQDGEDNCANCRDFYVLTAEGNITCLADCPDGTYKESFPHNRCRECSEVDELCETCRVSTVFECTECEYGYRVDAGKCKTQTVMETSNSSPTESDGGVCPLYTCMLPVIGGGVALVLVVVCVWVVCRRRARRSTRPPPALGDIGVMTTDREAGRNRQTSTGFDPPVQTTLETETPTQRRGQREVHRTGSASTENSRHKKKKKRKHSHSHDRTRRHHSHSSEAKVRSRERHRPRTDHHTGRREGDNNRVSVVSEGTKIYNELKQRGRGREELPPVPREGGQDYVNEDVIEQMHKAGPMTSPDSGATNGRRHETTDAEASSSRGGPRPAETLPGDNESHDYVNVNEEVTDAGEDQRAGGSSSARVGATAGVAAAASGGVEDATAGDRTAHSGEGQLDGERHDYVNDDVIKTLHKKGPHDYENKDTIEQLKKQKEKQTKHDYVNVDPNTPNHGAR